MGPITRALSQSTGVELMHVATAQSAEIAPPETASTRKIARRERRIWPRTKVNLFGLVTFGQFTAVRCVVKDYHFDGARLKVYASEDAPDVFELFVPIINLQRRAHVRWRRNGEIGVQFGA